MFRVLKENSGIPFTSSVPPGGEDLKEKEKYLKVENQASETQQIQEFLRENPQDKELITFTLILQLATEI